MELAGGWVLVAPAVRLVRAPNPSPMTGEGTNSYLIGEREVIVVDAGPASDEHLAALLAALGRGGRVVAQLVTHGHDDHLPGALALRKRTRAPILGHAALPGVDHALADDEEITIAGRRVIALATPGHAGEHLSFWLPDDRLLFAGDLVAGVGTIVLDDTPGSLARYLASLERIEALGTYVLLPGHGPLVADGRAKAREFLEHRAMRDRQILAALGDGALDVDALVARLYAATPPELLPMAARNVRAHLERLIARGRVVARDGAFALSR